MNNIRKYVDSIFSKIENTREARERKDELLSNLREKYEDLIKEGHTKEEAEQIVIDGIGDTEELISSLGIKKSESKQVNNLNTYGNQKKKSKVPVIVGITLSIVVVLTLVRVLFFGIPPQGLINFNPAKESDNISNNNSSMEPVLQNQPQTINDVISTIDVTAVQYDVVIEAIEDVEHITLTLLSSENDFLRIDVSGEQLSVSSDLENRLNGSLYNVKGTITIQVPVNTLKDIDIENVSGNVTLIGPLTLNKLSIENVSGGVRADHLTVHDKLHVDIVSGDTSISTSSVGEVHISSVSGDVELLKTMLTSKGTFDTLSGSVKISTNESTPNYHANFDSLSGSYKKSNTTHNGNDITIEVDTVSGDCDITD